MSLVLPVSGILGDKGGPERGSLIASTVKGLLLIVDSASYIQELPQRFYV